MRPSLWITLAPLFLLPLAACGPSRLSDGDITRLCMLQVECGAGIDLTSCEAAVTTQRDAANAAGCGGQLGAAARCVIRAAECVSVPEDCVDEQMRLQMCQSRPRDTGTPATPDAGRMEGFPDANLECTPSGEELGFSQCTDGCDNDGNGVFDCNDEACCGSIECPAGSLCGGGSCSPVPENSFDACTDECDNDSDATIDCNDSGCCAALSGECPSGTLCALPAMPSMARTSNGFLEVFYMGEWRSVCDDSFDSADADVACRQLGYSGAETYMSVTGTTDSFWLDDLTCTGEESTLDDCGSSGWGVENCTAGESVQVVCF